MSTTALCNQKILIINPNSSTAMTNTLSQLISTLHLPATIQTTLWNPVSGPPSINNNADAATSCGSVLQELPSSPGIDLTEFDAFLVACYSDHPLTRELAKILPNERVTTARVLGIFEASVKTTLALLWSLRGGSEKSSAGAGAAPALSFGIVTTGEYWESTLTAGVEALLSSYAEPGGERESARGRFKGVVSTGLSAGELHSAPREDVCARMEEATRRLVRGGDVGAICLGCAGMAGMDAVVRGACVKELGQEMGGKVWIVDGVKAGISMLSGIKTSDVVVG
jgi:Asp/Glu/hydantoin racemase